MNKSQRIYFNSGNTSTDNYLKVQLEQDVDTIEFLTMSITTKDAYRDFNADYGVLVGRVVANNSIGIPNVKVSIFIPLSDDDAEDSETSSIYPYKTPRDKNVDGKRYNLLPRVARPDPITGVVSPKQPFGSFPIKEEIVTNVPFLSVYKKYYKYTALTNYSGDYMIFGVPIGTQTVHMSVDITDIGQYSMTPAAMVTNLGYSPNLFTDNNTRIKPSADLNDLPHIETQDISVDIIPFWGDAENFEIGITRQDFRIRSILKNTFTIFGSVFTDANLTQWGRKDTGDDCCCIYMLYRMSEDNGISGWQNIGISSKRVGNVTEKIYYYPENITDVQVDSGNYVDNMLLLDKSEYSFYKENGSFVLIVSCNRKRVVMDEQGNLVETNDTSQGGLYTEFKGFMTLEITDNDLPMDWTSHGKRLDWKPIRHKLKFPQYAVCGHGLKNPNLCCIAEADNETWRKEYYTFCGNGIYSVSRFHGIIANGGGNSSCPINCDGYSVGDVINSASNGDEGNAGLIQTNDYRYTGNTLCGMSGNASISCAGGTFEAFGANWLNMSVYLPQTGWIYNGYAYMFCWRVNSQFMHNTRNQYLNAYFMQDNQQQIAGPYFNTCGFARSDLNWTDFIKVCKEDVLNMNQLDSKGFKTNCDGKTINALNYALQGTYRNGTYNPNPAKWCAPAPIKGGKCNGNPTCASDGRTYFFKGVDTSDCVAYLVCLGIV